MTRAPFNNVQPTSTSFASDVRVTSPFTCTITEANKRKRAKEIDLIDSLDASLNIFSMSLFYRCERVLHISTIKSHTFSIAIIVMAARDGSVILCILVHFPIPKSLSMSHQGL